MASKRLEVVLAGDASGALKAFGDTETKAGGLGDKLGGLGGIAGKGLGAVAAAGVVAGVALYKVGSDFDSAFDKIRVGTGKTGGELEALKGDFKAVAADTPASFDDVSTAVAGLNQKLGLTGTQLESRSTQLLELSRITKTDLNTNIEQSGTLFNNWNVAAQDQGDALDFLFRTTQLTGIGFQDLSGELSDNGVKLRALGFSLEDAAALFGGLKKAGIDAGDVMPAFSKALASAAKAGKDAHTVLSGTFDAIRKAPNATVAAGDAVKVFGAKAGPQLAAAIREGKLSVGELENAIASGTDTIIGAGKDTEDFGEKWQKFVNRMEVAIEPLASGVFDTVGSIMDSLGPTLSTLTDDAVVGFTAAKDAVLVFYSAFTGEGVNIGPELGDWTAKIADLGNRVRDVADTVLPKLRTAWDDAFGAVQATITWLGDHKEILDGLKVAIGVGLVFAVYTMIAALPPLIAEVWALAAGVIAATWPFLAIGAAITLVAAGILYAYNNWGWFKTAVDAVGQALVWVWNTVLVPIGAFIIGTIIPVIANLAGKVAELATNIPQWIGNIPGALGAVVEWFESLPGLVLGWLSSLWGTISGWVVSVATALPGLIAGWATAFFSWIVQTLIALPGQLAYLAGFVIGWVIGEGINLGFTIASWVTSFFSWVENVITQLPGWLANVVANIWGWISSTAAALPGQLWQWIVQFSLWAYHLAGSIGGWLLSTAASIGEWIWSTAISLPGRLVAWFDQFREWAFGLARNFGGWLVGAANAVWNWIAGIPGYVAGVVSGMADIGRNIASSIWDGIKNSAGWLRDRVVDFAKGIVSGVLHGLEIKSPSKVMVWAGQMMAKGIGVGFESGASGIQQSINRVTGNIAVALPPTIAAGSVRLGGAAGSLGAPGGGLSASGPAATETHIHIHVDGVVVHDDAALGRYVAGALKRFRDQGGQLPSFAA